MDAPFGPEMVVVPAGTFTMGSADGVGSASERPQHQVTIPHAIAVGRIKVTFAQWVTALHANGVRRDPSPGLWGSDFEREPVVGISWYDAKAYVKWLSRNTGKPYRLLSEAEWEYACQAGPTLIALIARGVPETNSFDLHDMYSDIGEWCEDCWNPNYLNKPESLHQTGGAWTAGNRTRRVVRAGQNAPSAQRIKYVPNNHSGSIGFRVARALIT